jgi:predicted ArsR family transcriptional regulator
MAYPTGKSHAAAASPGRPDRRRDVLRVLHAAAPAAMSIAVIADELGVHPNTVRFHLRALVGDELVQQAVADRGQPGRPPLEFRATRQMDRSGPRQYRLLAEILTAGMAGQRTAQDTALAAGRAWGRRLEPPAGQKGPAGTTATIDHLVRTLDTLGFAPEPRASTDDSQIRLRHCPFLELAEHHARVICPIHLGLMQGALEQWGASIGVEQLDAFVEPDLCVAHLSTLGAIA